MQFKYNIIVKDLMHRSLGLVIDLFLRKIYMIKFIVTYTTTKAKDLFPGLLS